MADNYILRQAEINDLEEIANLERICFPEGEAASETAFSRRLKVYKEHFWILELDNKIVGLINGMVTNELDLQDEMYHNEDMHNEQGEWQMIFGVETHPEYQNRGYASILINKMIGEAQKENRKGLVLTCKEKLIHYYEKFGFVNEGISGSVHGNTVWYQMRKKI